MSAVVAWGGWAMVAVVVVGQVLGAAVVIGAEWAGRRTLAKSVEIIQGDLRAGLGRLGGLEGRVSVVEGVCAERHRVEG